MRRFFLPILLVITLLAVVIWINIGQLTPALPQQEVVNTLSDDKGAESLAGNLLNRLTGKGKSETEVTGPIIPEGALLPDAVAFPPRNLYIT